MKAVLRKGALSRRRLTTESEMAEIMTASTSNTTVDDADRAVLVRDGGVERARAQ
jgi:hypothetical protein